MSGAPGSTVEVADSAPTRIADVSTGAAFMAGLTERGNGNEVYLCRSISHFRSQLGERYSDPTLYDAADAYFREGGSILYIARVLGPAAAKATDTIAAASGTALTVTALTPGLWGNDIDVANDTTGGNFVLTVSYQGTVVETSPVLATTADAVAWAAANSNYIRLAVGTGADPIDDTANLAAGTGDDGSITDASWRTALALFTADYGPGQVAVPGRTTSQGYIDLLAHADQFKRVALPDGADTHTVATLTTASTALRGEDGERFAGLFAPWYTIPGLAAGTTRTVPPSAVQAGLIARSDAAGNNPNIAAAGKNGIPRYATDLSQAAWTEAERATLNDAGVNVVVRTRTGLRVMGDRTLVNPDTQPNWVALSNSRLMMGACAKAREVLSDFEFAQMDGRHLKEKELEGRLKAEALQPFYLAGALYGRTPEEAFTVDVGPDVNTPETIADGEIHAAIALRVSPRAEIADVVIVKVPVTEVLS